MTAQKLSLDILSSAITGNGAAIRLRSRLQPAGGPGDKIFPPTYAEGQDGKKHDTRYATETRVIDGERKESVLLDSVAAQANRMELALLGVRRRGDIRLPLLEVSFEEEFPELGAISTLDAPHRVYDAIFRDSTLNGEAFRASEVGRKITDSSPRDARAMYAHCPTALLFGAWDSTGPRGGLGHKFQRALASEVVAIGAVAGAKVGSRLDPLQIAAGAHVNIPKEDSDNWTVDESGKSKQRPSEVNHSNIAPTRDEEAGGVTCEYALHTAVLSLPALRRLEFGDWSNEGGNAARVVLASLGTLALLLQRRAGYDFRSRCSLIPEAPAPLELVAADGSVTELEVDIDEALELYAKAVSAAQGAGAEWVDETLGLEPMPKLLQLIRVSQQVHQSGKPQA